MQMITQTIHWKNTMVDVEFDYTPYMPGPRDKWGQLESPDHDPEYEIHNVFFEGKNIMPLLDENDIEQIIEILEKIRKMD